MEEVPTPLYKIDAEQAEVEANEDTEKVSLQIKHKYKSCNIIFTNLAAITNTALQ
jgi:hypothetical protein